MINNQIDFRNFLNVEKAGSSEISGLLALGGKDRIKALARTYQYDGEGKGPIDFKEWAKRALNAIVNNFHSEEDPEDRLQALSTVFQNTKKRSKRRFGKPDIPLET